MPYSLCNETTRFESLSGLWGDAAFSMPTLSDIAAWQRTDFDNLSTGAVSVADSSRSMATDSVLSVNSTFNIFPALPLSNYDHNTDAMQFTSPSVASSLVPSPPSAVARSTCDACVQTQESSVDMLDGHFDTLPVCKPSADDWLLFAPRLPTIISLYSPGAKGRRGREAPTVIGDGAADDTKRSFVCLESGCGKGFLRVEHLRRHVRSIHTGEKRKFASDFTYSIIVSDYV
jgi:uncharacterized Zn-finger protein